ncbi:MAG: lipopolysaccharide assembly protein LapB, partial [Neisseriaceae bacterium]|nr:lipopolysaccharide assembly protein LapB [Neisseriaceae bacterium]
MDLYLWWLGLLPIFFGLGWLAARVDMNSVLKQAASVPTVFFKALDALVDNQTDMATRSLAEMARQTNDADLQLTLGKLYRQRGENDLAIRLHQKMLDMPDLIGQKRDAALFELAQDFHKLGLVDRAESLLLTLQESHVSLFAKRLLLSIYQQDRNWRKAIEMASALRDDAHHFSHEVAQFYCELAQAAFYHTDYQEAKLLIKEAFLYNRRCVRANIILGDVAEAEGDDEAAIEAWQAIEQQNADYLGMVSERLFNAYYRLS